MEFEFALGKSDFVTYQLFMLSQVEGLKKKRKSNLYLPIVYCLIIGVVLSVFKGPVYLVGLVTMALAWFLVYPFYSKFYYRQYYSRFVKKHYKSRIDLMSRVSIKDDLIYLSDESGEASLEIREIKNISEIKTHIFVVFNSGMAIILPKDKIDTFRIETFVQKLEQQTGVARTSMPEWEWK